MTVPAEAEQVAPTAHSGRSRRGAAPSRSGRSGPVARADFLALVALTLLTLAMFRDHVFRRATFIGDFDRMHTSLAFLRSEVADLHGSLLGAWDDRLAMGSERYAFPPMHPNPLVYLAALVPIPALFYAAGLLSLGTLTAAAWAAYAFIRSTCGASLPAFCGAALYVCSTTALINVVQYDMAVATLVYAPLVLLLVRNATRQNAALTFAGCVVILAAAFWWTSLAFMYTVPLFAAYAAYRAVVTRSWLPLLVLAAAGPVAGVIAMPRLVAIWEGLSAIHRSTPVPAGDFDALYAYQNITPREFWRWLDDGIFGRFQGEARALDNNINLHEGMQFYTSNLTPFLIVAGAVLFARRRGLWGARDGLFHLLVVAVVLAVVVLPPARYLAYLAYAQLDFTHARATIAGILSLCTLVALFVSAVSEAPLAEGPGVDRPRRAAMIVVAAGAVAIVLGVGLDFLVQRGPPVRINLAEPPRYWLSAVPRLLVFGTVRLTPAAPVGLAASTIWSGAVALHWQDVAGETEYQIEARGAQHREFVTIGRTGPNATIFHAYNLAIMQPYEFRVRACAGPYCGGFSSPVALTAGGPDYEPTPGLAPELIRSRITWVSSPAVASIAWGAIVLAGLVLALAVAWRRPTLRRLGGAVLGLLMVYQGFAYASFQLAGPHTRGNAVPFENGFVTAEPTEYVPPGPAAVAPIREALEAEEYRTAFVCDPTNVPFACGNLLSALWDVRTVNAYSVGLPGRLALLPWSPVVQGYRSIAFPTADSLPWPLLALLNVKYAVVVDRDLYTGVDLDCSSACDVTGISPAVLENPFPVAPRAFFPAAVEVVRDEQAAVERLFPADLGGRPAFDVTERSVVEGPDGPLDPGASEPVRATFEPDRVVVRLDPVDRPRLLVLNELYSPRWRAFAAGTELPVRPVNVVMRGVIVPPGAADVELRYVPFTSTPVALVPVVIGLGGMVGLAWAFRRLGALPEDG